MNKNYNNRRYQAYANGGVNQAPQGGEDMQAVQESLALLVSVGIIPEEAVEQFIQKFSQSSPAEREGVARELVNKANEVKQQIAQQQQMAQAQQPQRFSQQPQGGIPAGMGAQMMGMQQMPQEQMPPQQMMSQDGGFIGIDEFGNEVMMPAPTPRYITPTPYIGAQLSPNYLGRYQEGGNVPEQYLTWGNSVNDFKKALNDLGYTDSSGNPLTLDNKRDKHMDQAVRNFQKEVMEKGEEDGILGRKTKLAMNQQLGRIGDTVRALQDDLLAAGFDPGQDDGIYGPKTAAAYSKYIADNPESSYTHKVTKAGIPSPKSTAKPKKPIAKPPKKKSSGSQDTPEVQSVTTDSTPEITDERLAAEQAAWQAAWDNSFLPTVMDTVPRNRTEEIPNKELNYMSPRQQNIYGELMNYVNTGKDYNPRKWLVDMQKEKHKDAFYDPQIMYLMSVYEDRGKEALKAELKELRNQGEINAETDKMIAEVFGSIGEDSKLILEMINANDSRRSIPSWQGQKSVIEDQGISVDDLTLDHIKQYYRQNKHLLQKKYGGLTRAQHGDYVDPYEQGFISPYANVPTVPRHLIDFYNSQL